LARGQDNARPLAASARVEIVAVEVEQHDTRPLDPFEQRMRAASRSAATIVELVKLPKAAGAVATTASTSSDASAAINARNAPKDCPASTMRR
jgi:hypothetical protein